MNKSIIKTIAGGVFIGAIAFFAPFLLLFFILTAVMFRIFFFSRIGRGRYVQHRIAFADHIRNMSDDEYATFKTKVSQRCDRHYSRHNHQQHTQQTQP